MKILIRGAGDLATGIASRLYRAGHHILMTEIPTPLTVRRSVAFSRAVCEGRAQVEDMTAVLAEDRTAAERVLSEGDIAVLVDETASCRSWYRPDVVVDAILAKKNLGTRITDAPFVIGVGPGFTAGVDCHCVVETKRGHTLGSVIQKGSAIPNTGVPGNVGGYTTERLIRAEGDGMLEPKACIGDFVQKGQVVAVTGGIPVYAQMSGILRGMLQGGVNVWRGLKIGDIDARAERSHCETISDKARAVGGGVLEAAASFERMKDRYAIVVLAAGGGSRFGGDKLCVPVKGRPLYEHTLEKVQAFGAFPAFIVTGSEKIARAAESRGICPVKNTEPEKGIAHSVKLGLGKALESTDGLRGVLFLVCDQPEIQIPTIGEIFRTAARHPGSIVCAGNGDRKGNPVCWDAAYFPELMELSGDEGGRRVMRNHREKIRIIQADIRELRDIDRKEDLQDLQERILREEQVTT